MFCQNCGKEVEEGDRFCKNCGVLVGYTREEGTPEQQQYTPGQANQQEQEQEQPAVQEPSNEGGQMGQQSVSFRQEEPQPSSSNKMMTWVIVGVVAFLGLITMIVLFVLFGAARRNAEPKLQEFRDQIEQNQDDYDFDDFYDYYDDEDDDYYDYDDEEDDDSYLYGGNNKHGGEQFF